MNKSFTSFLTSIPLTPFRLTLYCALLVYTLFGSVGYIFIQKKNEWEKMEERAERVLFLAHKSSLKQKERENIKNYYKNVDVHYLQHQLCPLILLEEEQKNIEKVIDSPGFCGNKSLENRLLFLSSKANSIKLKEQILYTSNTFKEVEVSLAHPIEASLGDIEIILKKIEEEEKKKPLLLTTQFRLTRKKPMNHNEVFEINLTVLKREFLDL
jgi:hypothetical protein